jgi:uncharacterized phage-associated protein
MASAHDVARYILEKSGSMSAMKLQKILYYCQAWSLVWDERPLFDEPIQAWANGPVVYEIYNLHRGAFLLTQWPKGNVSNLDKDATETIDSVVAFYGDKTAQWLSDLTHQESPWRDARQGFAPGENCSNEISLASMHEYYSSLA